MDNMIYYDFQNYDIKDLLRIRDNCESLMDMGQDIVENLLEDVNEEIKRRMEGGDIIG